MDNTAPVITEARPQPQQFADSQSHADQTSFYTRYFGNRVVNTLCTIASAAALYLMPVAGLLISTIVVIRLIYDRKVSVVPQDEVQPIVSRANDDVRAADSGPLETTSGSRCVIIPQTGPTPLFTHEAEATLTIQPDDGLGEILTSEGDGALSPQIQNPSDLYSKPTMLVTEQQPHEPRTGRQTPDTAVLETTSQYSLTVETGTPSKNTIESINLLATDLPTSPLPELGTSSQSLAHSTLSTSPEVSLATLSDTELTGRELVRASNASVSSLNGQTNDLKAFYFTVDVTFSRKDVQVGFKPLNESQLQSQSGTIATLRILPESHNALMPGQSNELLSGLIPLELDFKDANGMPSKAEPFVFGVSRDWIRKHINSGHNGAFLTFDRNEFNNHQLGQQLKPAIENGHQHPMTNGATVNGAVPLQHSLNAVEIESSKLTAPEFVLESHDSTSFGEHSTESSPKTLSTSKIIEDKPVERSLRPVPMVKELGNSSSEPTTDDESDDDTDSLYSGDNDGQKLTFDDSDIDAVLGESSEDNWSSSEEDTEAQANNETSSSSSTQSSKSDSCDEETHKEVVASRLVDKDSTDLQISSWQQKPAWKELEQIANPKNKPKISAQGFHRLITALKKKDVNLNSNLKLMVLFAAHSFEHEKISADQMQEYMDILVDKYTTARAEEQYRASVRTLKKTGSEKKGYGDDKPLKASKSVQVAELVVTAKDRLNATDAEDDDSGVVHNYKRDLPLNLYDWELNFEDISKAVDTKLLARLPKQLKRSLNQETKGPAFANIPKRRNQLVEGIHRSLVDFADSLLRSASSRVSSPVKKDKSVLESAEIMKTKLAKRREQLVLVLQKKLEHEGSNRVMQISIDEMVDRKVARWVKEHEHQSDDNDPLEGMSNSENLSDGAQPVKSDLITT